MASRMFAVDLGAWSVKLAIASPGIRGATLVNVVERLVPPGDAADRAAHAARARVRDRRAEAARRDRLHRRLRRPGVHAGPRVRLQAPAPRASSTRRSAASSRASCRSISRTWSTASSRFPRAPAVTMPEGTRGRVAPPAEGMRVLSYAMRRDRAEQLLELGKPAGFNARGLLACGGAAAKLVERTPSLMKARTDGAVAVIDIGHERTDVVVVHARQGGVQPQRSRAPASTSPRRSRATGSSTSADAERAKHADGFVASQCRAGDQRGVGADPPGHRHRADAVRARPAPDARGVPRAHRVRAARGDPRRRRRAAARHRLVPDRAARHPGVAADRRRRRRARRPASSPANAAEPADRQRGDDRRHGVRRRRRPPAVRPALGLARRQDRPVVPAREGGAARRRGARDRARSPPAARTRTSIA